LFLRSNITGTNNLNESAKRFIDDDPAERHKSNIDLDNNPNYFR
jgi:hypothetical protein